MTMVEWNHGKPNARLWVLKLLHGNFGPGDKIVEMDLSGQAYVAGLAVVTKQGKHKLLLVNKRDRNVDLSIPGATGAQLDYVDVTTGFQPPVSKKLDSDHVTLHGFSVAVVTLP